MMVRASLPGGVLRPEQWLVLDDLARAELGDRDEGLRQDGRGRAAPQSGDSGDEEPREKKGGGGGRRRRAD